MSSPPASLILANRIWIVHKLFIRFHDCFWSSSCDPCCNRYEDLLVEKFRAEIEAHLPAFWLRQALSIRYVRTSCYKPENTLLDIKSSAPLGFLHVPLLLLCNEAKSLRLFLLGRKRRTWMEKRLKWSPLLLVSSLYLFSVCLNFSQWKALTSEPGPFSFVSIDCMEYEIDILHFRTLRLIKKYIRSRNQTLRALSLTNYRYELLVNEECEKYIKT